MGTAARVGCMGVLAEKYRPSEVERAARELWATRGWPRPDGVIGRSTAPVVRQYLGSLLPGDDPGLVAFRSVAADADARYLGLAGRRALGTLRRDFDGEEPTGALLQGLSVWTGGSAGSPVDTGDRHAGIETLLGRIAALGLVVTRDTSLRICPSCAQARTPERIIYQQEEGDAYLVRFPLPVTEGVVHALVWVDAPWRLLGASALLVNPTLPYVVARYRRRGVDERILTSRASLARLLEWLPGGEVEVMEEGNGTHWQGRAYQYPLRHEFPMGGELSPPSGTVLAVPDVTDSGTGIVPLVPGHGGTDAQIADRLGITGWPLVTPRGQLDFNLAHKYSGLDLTTANEFVARDLAENGALFARLRVRRGVPHCALCGTALVWAPGRAWCLEPTRLPAERRDLYRRLLPHDPPVGQVEVAAWPVSEPQTASPGPGVVSLLECPQCERLAPLSAGPECTCGNHRNPVARRLLPSIAGALGAWARFDPFPPGDSAWLYVNERRRAPAVVHHLAAMSGVSGAPNDVGLTLLPGVPEGGMPELVASLGADAVRAALVRGERREGSGPTFPDRCAQEARRLERFWSVARDTLDRCDAGMLATFAQPIAGSLGELETEDRALLARWERVRLAVLADYDHQAAGAAYRALARFMATDLEEYVARVRPRLDRSATTPTRRGALRTLHHVLRGITIDLAPVAPHIAEVVHGALVPGRTSLFETSVDPLDSAVLDESSMKAWDRWGSVERAIARFRRRVGLAPSTAIPAIVAVAPNDELAAHLRSDRSTVQRLARVTKFEAFGPGTPWTGRQRTLEPVLSEIQRAYPTEANQILHLLRRMPARKRGEAATGEELSVVIHGLSRRILPSMVQYTETLPERFVPIPWELGELYAELPAPQPVPKQVPPPVSPDAFRLLARVERALRRASATEGYRPGPVLVAVVDPLASELRASATVLASFLGVPEVRVVDPSAEVPGPKEVYGRTRTGVRWWAQLTGIPPRPRRSKHRALRPRMPRVRAGKSLGGILGGDVDYASDEEVTKVEQIRSLAQELDGVLGAPLLGPTKIATAWAAGFRSTDDFRAAPFERIERLRGFERPIADQLVRKLGGVVPPPAARPRRTLTALPPPSDGGPGLPEVRHYAEDSVPVPPPPFAGLSVERPAPSPPPGRLRTSPAATVPPVPAIKASMPVPPAPPSGLEEPPVEKVPYVAPPVDSPQDSAPDAMAVEPAPPPPAEPAVADSATFSAAPAAPQSPVPVPENALEPAAEVRPDDDPDTSAPGVPLTEDLPAPPSTEITAESPSPPVPLEAMAPPSIETAPEAPSPTASTPGPEDRPEPAPGVTESDRAAEANVSVEGIPAEPGAQRVDAPLPLDAPTTPEGPSDETVSPAPTPREVTPEPNLEAPPNVDPPDSPAASIDPTVPPEVVAEPPPSPPAEPSEAAVPPDATLAAEAPVPGPAEIDAPASTVEVPSSSQDEPVPEAEGGTDVTPAVPETVTVTEPPPSPPDLPSPPPEVLPVAPLPPPTPIGGISLIVAPSYLPAFSQFLEATAAGHRGLCVVRESPDRLRAHVGPRPVEIYWLTNLGRGLTLRPNDLEAYGAFLQKAVEQDRITAVFLEGIEYLTRVHGSERIIERLSAFHVQAQAHQARVWVYLHPDLLPAADLAQFTAAFGGAASAD